MIQEFLSVFIPLLIIVNPSSTLALFSTITHKYSKKERRITAKNAVFYASILLIIFAFAGASILDYLSIEIYSLRIAGGILLSFVCLDMVRRGEQFGESQPGKEQNSRLCSCSSCNALTIRTRCNNYNNCEYEIS